MRKLFAIIALVGTLLVATAAPASAWTGDTALSGDCQAWTVHLSSLGANLATPPHVLDSTSPDIPVGAVLTQGETFPATTASITIHVNYPEPGGDLTHYSASAQRSSECSPPTTTTGATTSTVAPSSTTTSEPSSTTSTSAATTTTTSTLPPSSTTSLPPSTTTTHPPEPSSSSTLPPSTTVPPVPSTTSSPKPPTSSTPTTASPPVSGPTVSSPGVVTPRLAFTGSRSDTQVGIGLGLLLLGFLCLVSYPRGGRKYGTRTRP